ncbi:MAG: DUF2797 domain-containing protein [Bacteroidota bacterium]|nr:DUF2797 domain-containing protein [Bacteroidota bacterium]
MKGRMDGESAVAYSWSQADILDPLPDVDMADWVGKTLRLEFAKAIHCTVTGKKIRKTYGDGMSFEAFQNSPLAVESIIHPELSRIHEGIALRDKEWEEKHHNQPHVVYLSYTSGIKVGVTRDTNMPYRWIDQGASGATILANTPYRQLAGLIEVALKDTFADKTQWRAMLTAGNPDPAVVTGALLEAKEEAYESCPPEFEDFLEDGEEVTLLQYPSAAFPDKVTSRKLDSENTIVEGRLDAIKGQYLLFEGGQVFNVRRHSGYRVRWSLS